MIEVYHTRQVFCDRICERGNFARLPNSFHNFKAVTATVMKVDVETRHGDSSVTALQCHLWQSRELHAATDIN